MTRSLFSLALILIGGALPLDLAIAQSAGTKPASAAKQGESMAVYLLRQLNEREQEAYAKYETAVDAEQVDQVRRELQSVIDGYDRLITDAPDFAPAYVSYGLILHRTGNRDESYAMFLKADELDPGLAIVKNQLGNYMAEEGKYAEAYGFFLLARDLAPKEPLYDYQIGNLLVGFRAFFIDDGFFTAPEIDQKILQHFRVAARNAKNDSSFRIRYAQAFFDVERPDWEKALEAWSELLPLAGSEYEKQMVWLYMARVRFELGHHQAARKLLNRIDHPDLDHSKQTLVESLDSKYPR